MSILWLRLQFCLLELYIKKEEKQNPFTRVNKRRRFGFLISFVSLYSVFVSVLGCKKKLKKRKEKKKV